MPLDAASLKSLIEKVEGAAGYHRPAAFGVGIASYGITDLEHPLRISDQSPVLDTFYPLVAMGRGEHHDLAALLCSALGRDASTGTVVLDQQVLLRLGDDLRVLAQSHPHIMRLLSALRACMRAAKHEQNPEAQHRSPVRPVVTFISELNNAPKDAHDAYLRLHLLSHRLVKPHGQSLEGIFGLLQNVVWTSDGPFLPSTWDAVRAHLLSQGRRPLVHSVDKFPRMVDYVIPSGVRIADADRVRLGAHVGEGTTVMHEGFINFNAGTLGKAMVEGRISAGVVVGDGSDIGGGASILDTLSGGGKTVNSIGKGCLLGANAGLGISLGDHCTVEAGLYVTAGSKVKQGWDGIVVKASVLSGQSNLLFRRNSQSGSIEVLRTGEQGAGWKGLNPALHAV